MTPDALKLTYIATPLGDRYGFYKQHYPNGQRFNRLTLTLSKKGWSASVQWEGTLGARGNGATQEEAIDAAIKTAREKWHSEVVVP